MARYSFSNFEYMKEHGTNPKGTGHWAFIIKDAAVEGIAPETHIDRCGYKVETIFWVPGVWTLTEAKKRAAVILAANAVPEYAEIEVAP